MVMRIILVAIIVVAAIGIYGNMSPQGNMTATFENMQTSMTTMVYAGEFDDIKKSLDEFLYLRTIRGTDDGKLLAEKIDQRLNNLELVKIYCNEEISTLELVNERNPYEKLQEICPKLESLSLSKAAQLFRLI
jgi:hypothetical protein